MVILLFNGLLKTRNVSKEALAEVLPVRMLGLGGAYKHVRTQNQQEHLGYVGTAGWSDESYSTARSSSNTAKQDIAVGINLIEF